MTWTAYRNQALLGQQIDEEMGDGATMLIVAAFRPMFSRPRPEGWGLGAER